MNILLGIQVTNQCIPWKNISIYLQYNMSKINKIIRGFKFTYLQQEVLIWSLGQEIGVEKTKWAWMGATQGAHS